MRSWHSANGVAWARPHPTSAHLHCLVMAWKTCAKLIWMDAGIKRMDAGSSQWALSQITAPGAGILSTLQSQSESAGWRAVITPLREVCLWAKSPLIKSPKTRHSSYSWRGSMPWLLQLVHWTVHREGWLEQNFPSNTRILFTNYSYTRI